MGNEYRGKYETKQNSRWRAFYPVFGLIVLLIAGAIAYFVSPFVTDFVVAEVLEGDAPENMQLISGGAVFGLLVAFSSLVYSLFAAKPQNRDMLSEEALMKDKEDMEREERAKKRRKRQMLKKMRDRNDDV